MDYTSLITSEHAGRPRFVAMVGAVAQPMLDLQNFLGTLQSAFDLDAASGQRLDLIGARIGFDRNLRGTAVGAYVQAPPVGVVPLADSDYKVLIRGKIGANQWDGTVPDAFARLFNVFGPGSGSVLFIQDNQDMSIYVCVAGVIPSAAFKAALSGGYMQVRPAGVNATYLYPTGPGGALFGFDMNSSLVQGFDAGVWASTT